MTAQSRQGVLLQSKSHLPMIKRLVVGLALTFAGIESAYAVGTSAGREINNTAQADFNISGVAQTPIVSLPAIIFVDELLDSTVVNDDGGPIGVASPESGVVMQFTVTNTGNGTEFFRLIADDSVAGDDFNPVLNQIYLESNAIPGLQTGAGGDSAYILGVDDPQLNADQTQIVYVESNVLAGSAQNDIGLIQLRAVARTVFTQSGTDDPAAGGFPAVGTPYIGAGDLDDTGLANVTAVVGTSYDLLNLVLRGEGSLQVNSSVVTITKTNTNVVDPFGTATLVPGSILTYRIEVTVNGLGTAEALVVTDIVPADLEYQPGTLVVVGLPAGEEQDDDFAPIGTDNTGFASGTSTITVNLGDVVGGSPTAFIEYQAAIR